MITFQIVSATFLKVSSRSNWIAGKCLSWVVVFSNMTASKWHAHCWNKWEWYERAISCKSLVILRRCLIKNWYESHWYQSIKWKREILNTMQAYVNTLNTTESYKWMKYLNIKPATRNHHIFVGVNRKYFFYSLVIVSHWQRDYFIQGFADIGKRRSTNWRMNKKTFQVAKCPINKWTPKLEHKK